jgi:ankyrin repeat protein
MFLKKTPEKTSELDLQLLDAARDGNLAEFEKLIAEGANINAKENRIDKLKNYTPLIYASCFGRRNIVEYILYDKRLCTLVKIDAKTQRRRYTALHLAAKYGHTDIAKMLISLSPDSLFLKESKHGFTPLDLASINKQGSIIKFILDISSTEEIKKLSSSKKMAGYSKKQQQKKISAEKKSHQNPYGKKGLLSFVGYKSVNKHSELTQKLLKAAIDGDLSKLKFLIAQGADINVRDVGRIYGNATPLIHAARNGHEDIVAELLTHNHIDLRARTGFNDRDSALHMAAKRNHSNIVNKLLVEDRSLLTLSENKLGYTPLHWASLNGNRDLCIVMLDNGGLELLQAKTKDGSTPIHLSIYAGHIPLAEELLSFLDQEDEEVHSLNNYIQLVRSLESMTHMNKNKVEECWRRANKQEYLIMNDIFSLPLPSKAFEQFLKGGYLVINDDGEFYKKWLEDCPQRRNRQGTSKRHSDDDQYSIKGSFVKECVIGNCTIDSKKCTWIQLERHPVGLKYFPGRMVSFIKGNLLRKNVGAWGMSSFTGKKYLNVTPDSSAIEKVEQEPILISIEILASSQMAAEMMLSSIKPKDENPVESVDTMLAKRFFIKIEVDEREVIFDFQVREITKTPYGMKPLDSRATFIVFELDHISSLNSAYDELGRQIRYNGRDCRLVAAAGPITKLPSAMKVNSEELKRFHYLTDSPVFNLEESAESLIEDLMTIARSAILKHDNLHAAMNQHNGLCFVSDKKSIKQMEKIWVDARYNTLEDKIIALLKHHKKKHRSWPEINHIIKNGKGQTAEELLKQLQQIDQNKSKSIDTMLNFIGDRIELDVARSEYLSK